MSRPPTRHAPHDTDFLRFRDSGDVAALGRVFDALGPRLLLLALHVGGAAQSAEDLVQETFLQAMRDAARFDGTRPLEAWLAGILRHRAIDAARRRRRRGRGDEALDPDAHTGPARRPFDLAADREAVARVRAAIDALAPTYREVAILRLVHGLTPIEIARAVGRPAGTVRMQCKRALEQLRRALPASVFSAAVALTPEPGWAALRQTVIEAGGKVLPAGAAGAQLFTTAQKTWSALALLVVLAGGAVMLWPAMQARGPERPAPTPTPHAPAAAPASAAAIPEVAAEPREDFVPRNGHWEVTGRVRYDDGTAAARAVITARFSRGVRGAPLTTSADASGRFALDLGQLRELSRVQRSFAELQLSAAVPGGAGRTGQAGETERERPIKGLPEDADPPWSVACDLTILRGSWVRGRVVSGATGQPAPEALVRLHHLPTAPRPTSIWNRSEPCDAAGRFAILLPRPNSRGEYGPVGPPAPADFEILASSYRGGGGVRRSLGRLARDRSIDVGDLALRSAHYVEGRVVLADGSPAALLPFDLRPVSMPAPSFQALGLPSGSDSRFLPSEMVHGEPIPEPSEDGSSWRLLNDTLGADGSFRVDGIPEGEYLLRLRDFFHADQEFRVRTGAGPQRIVLGGHLVVMSVTDHRGEALPGAGITVNAWSPRVAPDRATVAATQRDGTPPHPFFDGRSSSLTDARGEYRLLVPDGTVLVGAAAARGLTSPDFPYAVVTFRADSARRSTALFLRLAPTTATGMVRFVAHDADEQPIETLEAVLVPPLTFAQLTRPPQFDGAAIRRKFTAGDTATVRVPAGRWRYAIAAGPRLGNRLATDPVEGSVLVGPGETAVVRVTLTGGGWLRLHPRAADGTALRNLQDLRFHRGAVLVAAAEGLPCTQVGANSARAVAVSVDEAPGAPPPRDPDDGAIRLGPFPPGPWTFRIAGLSSTGVPLASPPITATVRAGGVTDVELPMLMR